MVDGHPLPAEAKIIPYMRIDLQLFSGMTLKIDSDPATDLSYPTARIQKGLILLYEGEELCEEAVGFGMPILMRGLQTIFPGEVNLTPLDGGSARRIRATYTMNLEEKIAKAGTGAIDNQLFYAVKNRLAAFIRRLPWLRGVLTHSSNILRSTLAWETTYEPANFVTQLSLNYCVHPGTGKIEVELEGDDSERLGITEIIMMNEQGARTFDHYQDSDGVSLVGKEIGCWDQVRAAEAAFIDHKHQISFSLPQVNGGTLYRGRELIGKRLAWSGFGYSFPPSQNRIRYVITVKKIS
jgi:hypothetical protein